MEQTGDILISEKKPFWHVVDRNIRVVGREVSLKTVLTGLILFSVFVLFMGLVQFSTPDMPDNDGFYHIKMAYLMRTEGLKPDFIWLPLTILNPREFYNHHFLFHVLLIPFTFGNLVLGAKWAAVIFSSLAFLVVWRLLDRSKDSLRAFMGAGAAGCFRGLYLPDEHHPRPVSVIGFARPGFPLAVWQVSISACYVLGFIYVWFYNAFPLLLGVAGAYVLAVWLVEQRLDLRPLLYSAAGDRRGVDHQSVFPYTT
jgi:hypothetical protein